VQGKGCSFGKRPGGVWLRRYRISLASRILMALGYYGVLRRVEPLPMNSYDRKHFQLLTQISAGDWRSIAVVDADELNVLRVCRYIVLEQDTQGSERIALTPEGARYYHHLCVLDKMTRYAPTSRTPTFSISGM
jgi:hypothetical protein